MRRDDSIRIRIAGRYCVYCGEIASTDEHFPPASYGLHGFILPACRECNSVVGTNYPTDFEGRAEYAKERIRKRHAKELRLPDWSESEIAELKYNLRKGVLIWQRQKEIAKQRLAWNALAYLTSIDLSSDFVPTFAEDVFFAKVKKR